MNTTSATMNSHMEGFSAPKTLLTDKEEADLDKAAKMAEGIVDQISEMPPEKPLTYEQRLERFKISKKEANEIIDAVVTQGVYREEIAVSRSIKAVLATRTTKFNTFLADTIDIADPKKVGKLQQLMSVYQLAGSLERYGSRVLPKIDFEDEKTWKEAIEQRAGFVQQLASPVFLTLVNRLANFDAKILTVFSEGYEENF